MEEAGVDGALIVQPINHKFDHSYVTRYEQLYMIVIHGVFEIAFAFIWFLCIHVADNQSLVFWANRILIIILLYGHRQFKFDKGFVCLELRLQKRLCIFSGGLSNTIFWQVPSKHNPKHLKKQTVILPC